MILILFISSSLNLSQIRVNFKVRTYVNITVSTELYSRDARQIHTYIYIWVNWLYIFLRISRICAMRYGRNQHRSDINIHYIPNDPRSTSSPASSFARFPPSARTPLRLLPSVSEATAYRFVIYGESLASRLSDEARYRDSWRLVLRSSTSCTAASATSTL